MSFRGRGRGRGGGGARFGGPRLPASLMDEVDANYGSSRSNGPARRKAERKAARNPEPPAPTKGKRRAVEEEEAPRKRVKESRVETKSQAKVDVREPKGKGKEIKEKSNGKEEKKEKERKADKKELVLPEQAGGAVEDREIAWLEYMLKKEKAKDEDSDGVDDLLDFTDALGPGGRGLRAGEVSDGSDSEMGDGLGDFLSDGSEEFLSDDEEEEEVEEEEDDSGEDSGEVEDDGEEWGGIASDDAASDASDDEEESKEVLETKAAEQPAVEEATPAGGRYVPPHMRAAMLAEKAVGDSVKAAERVKLERKAQGLLNKLSEANIESILAETEKLFGEYSRNDVTTTLTSLVIQMIGAKMNLLDSFVVLYATLVGAVHRVVGLEFGAHFVQTLVKKYSELAAKLATDATVANTDDDSARETFNLLTLIAELYNSGVIGANLMYDLIRGFIDNKDGEVMSERSVEGLLKILKCCGSQLRSDDPSSLKDIVALVQDQTRGKDKEMTTRGRFMIETLVNLRSGKTKGLGAEREDVTRMRRFLSGLGKKRRLLAPEPLRVGLSDLLSADSRGKWWLVGAGWSGNPLVEHAAKGGSVKAKAKKTTEAEDEEVMLELARKQGMNTDVRRSVFVVLLTSEDYLHATDRLNAFKLTATQEREFVRVALHCCGMEETYNPYYTLVLNNLCANSYDHRFTLQYALWDLLRELGDGGITETRAANTAKSIAFLIARGSVDLTILKAVEFTELGKPTRKFLDTFLRTLLVATQTPSPLLKLPKAFKLDDIDVEVVEETFDRALSNPELSGGLAWVLTGIRKTADKDVGEREAEVIKVGAGAALQVLSKAI